MAVFPSQSPVIGTELYGLVREYADLGIHRTGTDVDRATADWLSSHLKHGGAEFLRQAYSFTFFDGASSVRLDGDEIPSMPLYYEALGDLSTGHVGIAEYYDGEHGGGLDELLEATIDSAVLAGYDALVIATGGSRGDLVAINCVPKLRNRIPVVLVPGRYAHALRANSVTVEYSAVIRTAVSTNITGCWNAKQTGPSVVITTPTSGWFACAGERGTGIAVALKVAERLSNALPQVPLEFVAPSGHELGYHGAWHLVEAVKAPPKAILHLGSCIATQDAEMTAIVHTSDAIFDSVANALKPMRINAQRPKDPLDPDCWVGESQCWAGFGRPMLSLAGVSPLFHTPDDIAEKSTTPELLETAVDCITKAAMALIQEIEFKQQYP